MREIREKEREREHLTTLRERTSNTLLYMDLRAQSWSPSLFLCLSLSLFSHGPLPAPLPAPSPPSLKEQARIDCGVTLPGKCSILETCILPGTVQVMGGVDICLVL